MNSLAEEGHLSPENIIALGSKRERFLKQKEDFMNQIDDANFKLLLDQSTFITGLRPLLA